ncbi:aldo-keto reductase-like protein [Xylogone sp. PMI_703]|nr:aldo-keto reductase-like protein [Xylogone sp. PMI_703]
MSSRIDNFYTPLGNSGLKVSKVILGAMSYGSPECHDWICDETKALPLLKYAFDAGINTWDTADTYSNGLSERIIGKALREYKIPREKVVLMTKCYFGVATNGNQPGIAELSINDGEFVNQVGLSRKHIFDAVDASVERLGTYIDVLQIHRFDRHTPKEEIMRALNDVIESGKVRYIGASTMAAWEFQALQNVASQNGWHKFISMQNYYNLLYREEEREMIPYCGDAGVGIIPWSPLARGILARPLNASPTIRESSDKIMKRDILEGISPADEATIKQVEELAKRKQVPMVSINIAWCLSKGFNPIIGLGTKERIDDAIESVKFANKGGLTREDVALLEKNYVTKMVRGY